MVELEKLLRKAGLYENPKESAVREEVLRDLQGIVDRWVKQLAFQHGYPDAMVEEATALLAPFGSYRLGVHGRVPVPDAHVPVMKMRFHDVQVDLVYASVNLAVVPWDLDLGDRSVLRGLDHATARSLNGVRVAYEILRLDPDAGAFRMASRCVSA